MEIIKNQEMILSELKVGSLFMLKGGNNIYIKTKILTNNSDEFHCIEVDSGLDFLFSNGKVIELKIIK
jgi:hypothetical protein